MKPLEKIFNRIAPHFKSGGRLHYWYPLFEATDSFLFGSGERAATAPHVRDAMDLKRIMVSVIVALLPCVIMAVWNIGYQANSALQSMGLSCPAGWRGTLLAGVGCDPSSLAANMYHGALYFLPIYLVSIVAGGFWECVFNIVRGHEMSEAFLVTSLLFALILPPTIPLCQAALGISFGIIFAKEAFGGVGLNFMNPALAARAFVFFAYPAQMSGDQVWTAVDGLSSATALTTLASAVPGNAVAALDFPWWQAFIGTIPGSMGETSTLACLIGAAALLVTGIASNPMFSVPPHWHLVLGGFAFGLVFMATDPVTAPHTTTGRWIYGFVIGVLAILIRVANPGFPEGVMLAILLGNVFAPLFDYLVEQANIKRRMLRHG